VKTRKTLRGANEGASVLVDLSDDFAASANDARDSAVRDNNFAGDVNVYGTSRISAVFFNYGREFDFVDNFLDSVIYSFQSTRDDN